MEAISEDESFRIAVMAASGDSPAAFRAASTAFSRRHRHVEEFERWRAG
jgi:hypothetical protein